jgi:hypothetical protein
MWSFRGEAGDDVISLLNNAAIASKSLKRHFDTNKHGYFTILGPGAAPHPAFLSGILLSSSLSLKIVLYL